MLSPFVLALLPHLILGFVGTKPDDRGVVQIGHLIDQGLGGVILFFRNIEGPDQLQVLTACLKARRSNLLIAVDQEGGAVQRLHPLKGFMGTEGAFVIGAAGHDPHDLQDIYGALARQLKTYGINWNLAPCVDLHHDASPAIGVWGRSYGRTPEDVISCAGAFIRAHQAVGIKTAIKHFPGHGLARGDTHQGFVDITQTYQEDENRPFEALKDLADSLLMAHVVHQEWDRDTPVSLSRPVIQTRLRGQGFEHILVADDVEMGAVTQFCSREAAICQALWAGCDYVIVSDNQCMTNVVTDSGGERGPGSLTAFFAALNDQEPGYPHLVDSLLHHSRPRQGRFLRDIEGAGPSTT